MVMYLKPVVQPVKFLELHESQRKTLVQEGSAIVLRCELSRDPTAHVDWFKDGKKLHPDSNTDTQWDGLVRTLTIHSSGRQHGGVYQCSTADDTVQFEVDVKGDFLFIFNGIKVGQPLMNFSSLKPLSFPPLGRSPHILPMALSEKYKMVSVGCPIVLQCEVSDPGAQVSWAKDEVELFCKTGLDMKRDGHLRKLMVHSAKLSDTGVYSCSLADDAVTFNVDVQGEVFVS